MRRPAAREDQVVDGGFLGRAVLVAAGDCRVDRARHFHHRRLDQLGLGGKANGVVEVRQAKRKGRKRRRRELSDACEEG